MPKVTSIANKKHELIGSSSLTEHCMPRINQGNKRSNALNVKMVCSSGSFYWGWL